MKKSICLGLVLFLTSVVSADKNVPVMYGGNSDFDACGGWGKVIGLKSEGDGFLAVRKGPSSRYKMIDKIYNDDRVWFCDRSEKWIGIVYGENCGTSYLVPKSQEYKGPCKSGWVYDKFVEQIAG
jgi:hypothetical protein